MSDLVEDWQSDKAFSETNLHMLESQLLTDVTFLVGDRKEKVRAHKFILVSRSCVFERMFCGPMSESESVEIPDTEEAIFKNFIRFMYTNTISLDAGSVLAVLYVARKYSVLALEKRCLEFCHSSLSPSNACLFLQQAFIYDEDNLKSEAMSVIESGTKECFSGDGFLELSQQCLNFLLKTDEMNIAEVEVFKAVVAWAEAECRRQKREVTPAEKRDVLGKTMNFIRFPQIPLPELSEYVYPEGILTDAELVLLFVRCGKPETPLEQFNGKLRKRKLYHLNRSLSLRYQMETTDRTDAVVFSCSRPTTLMAIYVYGGDIESAFNIKVEVLLKNKGGHTMAQTSGEISRAQGEKECQILLPGPVQLPAKEELAMRVICRGQKRWLCQMNKYAEMVDVKSGVTWNFKHSSDSSSSNSLEYGHITGFDYTLISS